MHSPVFWNQQDQGTRSGGRRWPGGTGIFRSAGYERLVRDARLGRIHPANSFLTHEVVAKTALGISLDEQPAGADEFGQKLGSDSN
jgi:alkylation response protein AidB-like acyl-CoA dehydrogenase